MLNLLHGRALTITPLAAIEANHHARTLSTRLIEYGHGLANGSPRSHHIINDHHIAGERRADNITALTVGLSFLAVKGKR